MRDIGLDRRTLVGPGTRMKGVETTIVETTIEIADELFLMSCAEMHSDAHIDPRFRRGAAETTRPDLFEDEISLVSVEEGGLSIVTGCAHRGILNIVDAARAAFPRMPIRAIVGGFHLASLPDTILAGIAEDLAVIGPATLYPAHCTGVRGFAALDSVFRGKATWLSCGMRIQL